MLDDMFHCRAYKRGESRGGRIFAMGLVGGKLGGMASCATCHGGLAPRPARRARLDMPCSGRQALIGCMQGYRGVGGRCQEQASTWVAPSVRQDSQHGQQPLGHLSNLLFSSAAGECSERTMDKPSNLGSYPTPMKPAAPLVMPLHLVSYSSQYTKPVEQVLREALRKGGPKR